MSNESLESDRKRSMLKAVTYRLFGTTLSALIAWSISHDLRISLGVFTFDGIGKIGLYYLHERAWNYIPWGNHDGGHQDGGNHEKLLPERIHEQHGEPGKPNLA
jgi:uncharacterized membrane protein